MAIETKGEFIASIGKLEFSEEVDGETLDNYYLLWFQCDGDWKILVEIDYIWVPAGVYYEEIGVPAPDSDLAPEGN